MSNLVRKDPIIVTEALIGREVFFLNNPYISNKDYVTPNKRYMITYVSDRMAFILDNVGDSIPVMLNISCAFLDNYTYWKLARRTSSAQNKVRTKSGRLLG